MSEIINAHIIGEVDLSYMTDAYIESFNICSKIKQAFPDSQISTYTYKPLVGILTTSNPRGMTTYYKYDSFNRLARTYIKENGINKAIQSYDYHYQNQ